MGISVRRDMATSFYMRLLPISRSRAEWWDNQSSKYSITSANKHDSLQLQIAFSSPDIFGEADGNLSMPARLLAYLGTTVCRKFAEDLCQMDDKLTMGRGLLFSSMSQRKEKR